MTSERYLIVNADDFGFTHDVNQGIITAHRDGILTATTLMANGPAFEDAVRLARENPSLDIGCHLVLIGGQSLITDRPFPKSAPQLCLALARRQISIYEELAAQVRRILAAGLRPLHLDTHKHTHVLPPVLEAVARVAREFDIPWVRQPFDFADASGIGRTPMKVRWTSRIMRLRQGPTDRLLRAHQRKSADHFAGFQLTGFLDTPALATLLGALPPGLTELMCHPAQLGLELRQAPTRLKESRQVELTALTAPEVRAALVHAGVKLVSFRNLPATAGN